MGVFERESVNIKKMRASSYLLPDPGGEVVRECLDEIERLRGALEDIADPITAWQRDLKDGERINGAAAVHLSEQAETYRRMARKALTPNEPAKGRAESASSD